MNPHRLRIVAATLPGMRISMMLALAACAPRAIAPPASDAKLDDAAACDRGDGARCLTLAKRYRKVESPEYDVTRAVDAYRKGCAAGEKTACLAIAGLQIHGDGVPQDQAAAIATMERQCNQSFAEACTNLGAFYMSEMNVARDIDKGIEVTRRGCDLGDAVACSNIVYVIVSGAPTHDATPPDACTPTRAKDCMFVGARYFKGDGLPADLDRATQAFDMACKNGYPSACVFAGMTRMVGEVKHPSAAAVVFDLGCQGGSALACNELAVMHMDGVGTSRDHAKAFALYVKACKGGSIAACENAGGMYVTGDGVGRDVTLGVRYLALACTGGMATACNDLGAFYAMGRGLPKDMVRAGQMFSTACTGGDASGCRNRDLLGRCAAGELEACRAFDKPRVVP